MHFTFAHGHIINFYDPVQLRVIKRHLERTTHNSSAIHDRKVFAHSTSWKKDMDVLKKMWGEGDIPTVHSLDRSSHEKISESRKQLKSIIERDLAKNSWRSNGPGITK